MPGLLKTGGRKKPITSLRPLQVMGLPLLSPMIFCLSGVRFAKSRQLVGEGGEWAIFFRQNALRRFEKAFCPYVITGVRRRRRRRS